MPDNIKLPPELASTNGHVTSPNYEDLTFVDALLEYSRPYESATSFWRWSAYLTIAAILRDSVHLPQGDSKLFPNIYVLFLADSGQRKGKPVDFSLKLVSDIKNTKIISGRSSIQSILLDLSKVESDKETGKPNRGGSAVFYAPELTAGLVNDPAAIGIITDIYEYKEKYDKGLVGGKIVLEHIVFSFFGASNEALLKELYDNKATQGGLLARTFVVTPNENRPANSLFSLPNMSFEYLILMKKLKDIAALRGQYIISEAAKKEYDSWYIPYKNSLHNKKDKIGILGRIHTSILKLSLILAANDLTLEVSANHIEQAIAEGFKLLPNYNMFAMTGGTSDIAECGRKVLELLMSEECIKAGYKVSRKKLLRDHWLYYTGETLDTFIAVAEGGELIKILVQGSDTYYILTEIGRKKMEVGN